MHSSSGRSLRLRGSLVILPDNLFECREYAVLEHWQLATDFLVRAESVQYFDLLLNEPWQWRKWKGPAQYEDKKTKTLMMLP